jgi:hypothetical protein
MSGALYSWRAELNTCEMKEGIDGANTALQLAK